MNSLVARNNLRRVAQRAPRQVRTIYSASAAPDAARAQKWKTEDEAATHHATETTQLWRKITFYVALPAIVASAFWVRNVENEHEAHMEHEIAENGGKFPQPPNYEYLNRRVKPFPWGNNSLFFNPKVNKDHDAEEE